MDTFKTVECISPAHPDKLCDQISDIILDLCLAGDRNSRVAIETMIGHGSIYVCGEVTTKTDLNPHAIRSEIVKVLEDNRYNPEDYSITTDIVKQSNFIANGVDTGGAGDQGIMVGYATKETDSRMPFEYEEARNILQDLRETYPETRDSKSQVTTKNGKIETIVVSAERLKTDTIKKYLEANYPEAKHIVNPCGDREGGPDADTGVTGRKLAVDNYGPQIEIGGGAFSGKDPSKVDRSGAYIARYIAMDMINRPEVERCKVKIAYSIGVAEPVMVDIQTNIGRIPYEGPAITPTFIANALQLKHVKYYNTAKRGHFGNNFNWG